jgi:hypothetical protein
MRGYRQRNLSQQTRQFPHLLKQNLVTQLILNKTEDIIMFLLKLSIYLFLLTIFFPKEAFAYIDPGIGSMLLQGAAAALIAGLIFFRNLRMKILDFFEKKSDEKPAGLNKENRED